MLHSTLSTNVDFLRIQVDSSAQLLVVSFKGKIHYISLLELFVGFQALLK